MQQENKYKIEKIEKYRDDLKSKAFFYAEIIGLEIIQLSLIEALENNIQDEKIKMITYIITAFAGVTGFSITLLKTIKAYYNYFTLNNAIKKHICTPYTKDLLIKLHLEDTSELKKERNLC